MQLSAGGRQLGHLTYCTNIHAGEAWPDLKASLAQHLPLIKAGTSPDGMTSPAARESTA